MGVGGGGLPREPWPNSLRLLMQLFSYGLPHHVPPAVHQTLLMAGSLQHNICRQPSKCTCLLWGFLSFVFPFFFVPVIQTCCCEILLSFPCDKCDHYEPERIKAPICTVLKYVRCEWIWGFHHPTVALLWQLMQPECFCCKNDFFFKAAFRSFEKQLKMSNTIAFPCGLTIPIDFLMMLNAQWKNRTSVI